MTHPLKKFTFWLALFALTMAIPKAWAQSDCRPYPPELTRVVDQGPIKTVTGPLAEFDPCHRSVQLSMPYVFSTKRGVKPPVVIIVHGGGGLSGYEREFVRWFNQNGWASLVFDAFQMNGLTSGSDLVLYQLRNSARQRMIFKAAVGAYEWLIKQDKVDTHKVFLQGQSNGASVVINMAAVTSPERVRGVIAEAGPSAGIGFPNQIQVPLLLIYGAADVYGGNHAQDFMHLRGMPCVQNEWDPSAPPGFAEHCNPKQRRGESMPSPLAWYDDLKAKGADVQFELIAGGGHGMMFESFSSSARALPDGRMMYISRGASSEARTQLSKLLIQFLESRL